MFMHKTWSRGFCCYQIWEAQLIWQALNKETAPPLYSAATDALVKIQMASRENTLPHYDEALLRRELNLFPEWYIAKHLGVTLSKKTK